MPPEEEKINPPIKSLRTYQGDVQEAVTKNDYSATDILTAEQKRRDKTLLTIGKAPNTIARNRFFTLVGGMLLLLGIITIVAVYLTRPKDQTVTTQTTKALISFSEEKDMSLINVNREELIGNIISEKQAFNLPVNSVLYINTVSATTTPANIENVLTLIAPKMPAALVRSFDEKYMLGVYSFDTNDTFLILTTSDYASSYAGMLKWEKDMPADLGEIFGIPRTLATTTNAFADESSRNKDLRVLKDGNNKTILLYSFIDKNTLLITTNENIFTALVAKYLVSKQVR